MKKTLLICFVGLCYCSVMNAQQKRTSKNYTAKKFVETSATSPYATELNKHLTNYELFELNTSAIYDMAEKEAGQFQFQLQMADGHVWDITAEKFDVRSADYKLIVLSPNGRETFPKGPTTTYKGFVNGDPENTLRMSITKDYISALFKDASRLYNIEPITQYVQNGSSTHYVVYESTALRFNEFKCGTIANADQQSIQRANQLKSTGINLNSLACAQADVAFAATSDLVNARGKGTKTGTEIYLIDFFNKSELYFASLQIKHVLRGMVISMTTQTNMTNSTVVATVRSDFASWAIAGNGFAGITHDIGSVIISKGGLNGVAGQATLDGLCATNKDWHYMFADVVVGAHTLAHEYGHMWGTSHDNATVPGYPKYDIMANSCPTNDCVMMASDGYLGPVGKWSSQSISLMEARKTGAAAACLSTCGVTVPPTVAFSSDKIFDCGSLTAKFTDNSINAPSSWAWDFGDGGTSTLQNPSHTYTQAGTYTVKLVATNSAGSNTNTKTNYITVAAGMPSPIVSVGPDTNGTIATFSSTSASYRAQYFQTLAGVRLKSILVYTGATAGNREFMLTDTTLIGAGQNIIFKDTVILLPANSATKINLNWDIPTPGYYALGIRPEGTSFKTPTQPVVQDVRRSTNAKQYPYTQPGLISIYSNLFAVAGKTPPVQWYVGYHWEVQSFNCVPVGISNAKWEDNLFISISPNPSSGLFTLKYLASKEEKVSLEVYNLMGEKISTNAAILSNHNTETIDLTNRAKGVYIVRIIGEGHQSIQQIINE